MGEPTPADADAAWDALPRSPNFPNLPATDHLVAAAVIPTRGDRPEFLEFCRAQLDRQTRPFQHVFVVDDPPPNPRRSDVTWRYRTGCQRALAKGCHVIVFWEDDDWYHPTYAEWLLAKWFRAGAPNVFGVGETHYYHLEARRRKHFRHPRRASAFCTLIHGRFVRDGGVPWPSDTTSGLDMRLWRETGGGVTIPWDDRIRAVGIKHGIGRSGGGWHRVDGRSWIPGDARAWFEATVDAEALAFYDDLTARHAAR